MVFGSIGDRDDRLGEHHLLEHDRVLLVAERVARARVAQADRGVDVAGVALVELFALVGVHAQDAADALALAARGVQHRRAALELARVDAEEGEVAETGSLMILNASAANGSLSSALRSISACPVVRVDRPSTGGMSSGDGR